MTGPEITLRLDGVGKRFGSVVAVDGLSLEVHQGEFVALLGSSGCGKTTALRLVAGLDHLDAGTIDLAGVRMADRRRSVAPNARRVGMVFQEHALFPHLTVQRNVGYGMSGRSANGAGIAGFLELVGLDGLGNRYPHELSGGQQQRVALARALATRPDVLLLDEPFSSLDPTRRVALRNDVRSILRQSDVTVLMVTHDQEEALSMADRVAIMEEGRIAQIARPEVIYHRPATQAIAMFVGEAFLFPGTSHGTMVETAFGSLRSHQPHVGQVTVLIRPEMFELHPLTSQPGLTVTIGDRQFFGHDQLIDTRLPDGTVISVRTFDEERWSTGDQVALTVRSPVQVFPGAAG